MAKKKDVNVDELDEDSGKSGKFEKECIKRTGETYPYFS